MACEACNSKFNFFTRKKQCMDCKRYFCSECVIKRLGKILSCDSCSMLSRRPLMKSSLVQFRSKDLRLYLMGNHVSVKGCIEKEDLIKLLIAFANGTNDTEDTENMHRATEAMSQQRVTENYEPTAEVSNQRHRIETPVETSVADNDIAEPVSRSNVCVDSRTGAAPSEGRIPTNSNAVHSVLFGHNLTSPVKLSDINALSDLEYLNVKQLKKLLSANRVDYKSCIEKDELLKRVSMLWKEYKESRTEREIPDENVCKICWDEPIECVILECGHMACCLNCGKQMSECPICKQYVVRVVRFFKA